MGYNVKYRGRIKYADPLNELDALLDEDVRDHPDWILPEKTGANFIDWEKDGEDLIHNGAEKSYDGANQLRTILLNTQDVGLYGTIRYTDDYGGAGIITCTGREVTEKVLVEG